MDGVDVLFGFHIGFKAEGPGSLICGTQGFWPPPSAMSFSPECRPCRGRAGGREGCPAGGLFGGGEPARHFPERQRRHPYRRGQAGRGEAATSSPLPRGCSCETRGETTELDAYMTAESERILRASADPVGLRLRVADWGNSAGGGSSPELARLIATVAEAMGGWKTVIPMSGFGATEDFACLMSRVQASGGLASYLQVGTDRAAGHHSDRFDFDETLPRAGAGTAGPAGRAHGGRRTGRH